MMAYLIERVKTDNTDGSTATTDYGYDKAGNRTSMTENAVTATGVR